MIQADKINDISGLRQWIFLIFLTITNKTIGFRMKSILTTSCDQLMRKSVPSPCKMFVGTHCI